ncbi:MAG: haloacid dehalogenase [Dehalococcoidales bacterium]|nr:haloacid dehalogenase [Dehalococcoidales bacterium]
MRLKISKLIDNLETITEQIRLSFTVKDAAREKILPLCREIIRYCSNAIRAVHRQEFDQAYGLLLKASQCLEDSKQDIISSKELSNTGILKDAQKEFAEGSITLALIMGKKLPSPDDLGVDYAAYLNGMGEAVGELRRYLLDGIRRGDLSRGGELLSAMDEIYSVLVTIDFPDAITGGLRRTTDMVRGVLERTRSDLTLVMSQKNLENRLGEFREKL